MLKHSTRGFGLLELMIVIGIIAILTVLGLPALTSWIQNARTRSVAESLQNGIRFAQGEAARMSRQTRLITTSGSSTWTVKYVPIAGKADEPSPTTLMTAPAGNLDNVTIVPAAAGYTVLQFNDLGRVSGSGSETGTYTALVGDAIFNVTNGTGTTRRKLSVRVSPSGKVRMCDPDKTFDPVTTPDGC